MVRRDCTRKSRATHGYSSQGCQSREAGLPHQICRLTQARSPFQYLLINHRYQIHRHRKSRHIGLYSALPLVSQNSLVSLNRKVMIRLHFWDGQLDLKVGNYCLVIQSSYLLLLMARKRGRSFKLL
jgi:hypothetical protein